MATPTESTTESVQDSPVPTDLTRFTRGPSNVAALIQRADTVESQFKEFNNRLARAEIELGNRFDRKRVEINSLADTLSPMQRQASLEKAATSIRREVVTATDEARWEVLRQMAMAEREIIAVESQFASPSHILMRSGLGTPERSRYLEQLANSGPFEIQNYAALAVATNDKVLAAAILSKLDGLSKRERELVGVSRSKLAEAMAGAEFKNAQAAIQRIRNRLREAMASNRGFQSGKRLSARDKIGLALKREAEVGADDGDD